jgi:hypothetical protein
MSLDDELDAAAFANRAIEIINDREAAEDLDVMDTTDAIAAVALATVAVVKRLSTVGGQLDALTATIDRLGLDAVKRELHREQLARMKAQHEIEELGREAAREDRR